MSNRGKEDLLFLVHRIPFPPNKGDKIRSYHILQHLVENFRVHLAAFVDDKNDWQYLAQMDRICASIRILPLNKNLATIRSLSGLFRGMPLSLPYYFNSAMSRWVSDTIDRYRIGKLLVYSSAMAQYVPKDFSGLKLIDFVDVDSAKWRQYAGGKTWPWSWIYAREADCLLDYDRSVAARFDASFFVSANEAELFKSLAPESRDRIRYFNNGVDTDYFSPSESYANPFPRQGQRLVFTGVMDYWANVDAVVWFVREVFAKIRQARPDTEFYIVGANPTAEVLALAQFDGVVVTGRVDDIRPYLVYAQLCIAPLRIARGIQNKVLEALAMGKTIIATPAAMEGIPLTQGLDLVVEEEPGHLADRAIQLLQKDPGSEYSQVNRNYVLTNYRWEINLNELRPHLNGDRN